MNISLRRTGSRDPYHKFSADASELPGSPSIGYGRTKKAATIDLLRRMLLDCKHDHLGSRESLLRLDFSLITYE